MRILLATLALSGLAHAQDQVLKQGQLTDPFWGFRLNAPELRKTLGSGDPSVVFRGKCATGLKISIRVHEDARQHDAKYWMEKSLAAWKKKRALIDLVRLPQALHYKRKTLAGFWEHHGHAFLVRGLHCFELHVVADGKDATEAVVNAWSGFQLGDRGRGTLLVYRLAREKGRPFDDPQVLLKAGYEYATGQTLRTVNLPLAAQVLGRARELMGRDTYKPEELWTLYEYGGMARQDKPAEAIEWHALAEQAAQELEEADERRRRSAYNLACVCSRAGKLDDAFAALYRAYAGGKPVTDAHVSDDKDLENLRRDERWHTFWREKVKN